MGHEGSGTVEEIGPNVTKFSPGDHVVFAIRPMCGMCKYCSTNRWNLCEGLSKRIITTAGNPITSHGETRFRKIDGTK